MRVVFDANVVAAGVCWHGEGRLCLVRMARHEAIGYATETSLAETREAAVRLIQKFKPSHNTAGLLQWYLEKAKLVEPAPLGKQRSRDPKDDPYLAAALAAHALFIVSYDKDLLDLGKPFGIEIIHPAKFLKLVLEMT